MSSVTFAVEGEDVSSSLLVGRLRNIGCHYEVEIFEVRPDALSAPAAGGATLRRTAPQMLATRDARCALCAENHRTADTSSLVEGCAVGKAQTCAHQVLQLPVRSQACARKRGRLGRPPKGEGRRLRHDGTGGYCCAPLPASPPPEAATAVEDMEVEELSLP